MIFTDKNSRTAVKIPERNNDHFTINTKTVVFLDDLTKVHLSASCFFQVDKCLDLENRSIPSSPIVPAQFLLQRKKESRGTDGISIFLKLLLYIAIMPLHFLCFSWNLWYRMSDPISLWPFDFGYSFANTLTSKWCFHSAKKRTQLPNEVYFYPF